MKLVLASKNKKKLAEMNDILSHLGVEVCSEAEAGVEWRWRRPAPPLKRIPC